MASSSGMEASEMLKTFNAGIGLVLVVSQDRKQAVSDALGDEGENVFEIGRVAAGQGVSYSGTIL